MVVTGETWPMKMEHEVNLDRYEMSMFRWICGFIMLEDNLENTEYRKLLGLDPVSFPIKRSRLWWFGCVERKDDADWLK